MVERFIAETTGGYNCEISPVSAKDYRIGETYDEFCHRIAQKFLSWVYLILG